MNSKNVFTRKLLLSGIKILLGILLYCLFAFAASLWHQAKPLYGTISFFIFILLTVPYIYWLIRPGKNISRKKLLLLGIKILLGILLYCLFAVALFLGLQVKPLYGTIGFVIVIPLIALYVYWIIRSKKDKKINYK